MRGEAAKIPPPTRGRPVRTEVSRVAAISTATRGRVAHLRTVRPNRRAGAARADDREPGRWPATDRALTSEEAKREFEAGTPSVQRTGDVPDRELVDRLEGYLVQVLVAPEG
jgi:hypothetical protein